MKRAERSSDPLAIVSGTAVLPDRLMEKAVVVCRGGRISYVGQSRSKIPASAEVMDAGGGYITPGFIDIHIHGGGGADVISLAMSTGFALPFSVRSTMSYENGIEQTLFMTAAPISNQTADPISFLRF